MNALTAEVFAGRNGLDLALLLYLCLIIPAMQLRSSLRARSRPPRPVLKRHLLSMAMLGIPLLALAADWWLTRRPASDLGLGFPVPWLGQIGFGLGAIFVVVLIVSSQLANRNPEKLAAYRARLDDAGMLMRSSREFALFVVLAFLIGCGAEILFRGFLLWAFAPLIGVAGAVIVAALAYGIGHGFKTWQQALGSVAAAFAFTIAYAATHSLWWLMAIHTAAALHGGWSGYRLGRAAHP